MENDRFDRRRFLAASVGFASGAERPRNVRVPWSAGEEPPYNVAPKNAADCHHHIYDSRFPADSKATLHPDNATVADYRLLQQRLRTRRNVIVQPSTYGTDNRCLLDALRQFGTAATRGVAVVDTSVSDATLRELHHAGVCGIRFNLVQAGATTHQMIEPLAKRIAAMGWHIQINMTPEQILVDAPLWKRLPVQVVFDHLGHVANPREAAWGAIATLLQSGRCWVKLSGAYMDTKVGPPKYSDRGTVATAFVKEAPERAVWGTDWPHPTAKDKPDDAVLFDLLRQWCGTESVCRRILVHNPEILYGFR